MSTMASTTTERDAAPTATERDAAGSIAADIGTAAPLDQPIIHRVPQKTAVPWDSYPGGKGADGTYQTLINLMPPHDDYREPFLGGGAIMRHKRKAPWVNVGYDIDPDVVEQWATHMAALDLSGEYMQVMQKDSLAYLKGWSPRQRTVKTFFFIDPPYLDETLKTGRAPYRHRFTWAQHTALLMYLKAIDRDHGTTTFIMLCGLPNLQTENHLKGWHTLQYQNKTRRGTQTEQVWMNYPAPTELHDYRFLGADYRERERIKRKQVNQMKALAAMAPVERNAMLDLIRRTYP